MVRRFVAGVAIASLVLAACGGDDDDSTEATGTTEATDAPSTEAPPDTGAPDATTTSAAPDTTPSEDPLLDVLRSFEGDYSGNWSNTTFGSTGTATGTIDLDEDAGVINADVDLGGNVFGEADPDPESFAISIDLDDLGKPYTVTSDKFGDVTATLSADGSITVEAADVPGPSIATFSATVTFTGSGFEGTYTVTFEGGGSNAEGTFELAKS